VTGHVLILEDNYFVASDIEDCATKLGLAATITKDPQAAIRLVGERLFAAAFLDVNLHGGFEGLQVARTIHCRGDTPVVIVTAYDGGDLAGRMNGFEGVPIVFKPIHKEQLCELLKNLLRASPQSITGRPKPLAP
jgi:CheY-like chemotaxis protein